MEYSTAHDAYCDFCLWRYDPIASPENKWRSASLLFHSFDVIGVDPRIFELIGAIRKGFGVLNTVWGVKQLGTELAWEFYFYDYGRRERERSVTRFLDISRPYLRCGISVNESTPYFMFSIDINKGVVAEGADLDEIHIYIGNASINVSSGICYSLRNEGTTLENVYYFFDANTQMREAAKKAACSAYFDSTQSRLDQILWPELRKCGIIVVANKQNNDSVYFSRINVDQLVLFLRRMCYPEEIVACVEKNRGKLDHLLYDVGFDYRMEGGNVVILKSGYYGVF